MEPTMQEGFQLPELMQKIKALREAGLRAEHVAFSFMKRRVQPLMARDTLGYQYTGDQDTSRMPGNKSTMKTLSRGQATKSTMKTRPGALSATVHVQPTWTAPYPPH
jgi:hypothetical protein